MIPKYVHFTLRTSILHSNQQVGYAGAPYISGTHFNKQVIHHCCKTDAPYLHQGCKTDAPYIHHG